MTALRIIVQATNVYIHLEMRGIVQGFIQFIYELWSYTASCIVIEISESEIIYKIKHIFYWNFELWQTRINTDLDTFRTNMNLHRLIHATLPLSPHPLLRYSFSSLWYIA